MQHASTKRRAGAATITRSNGVVAVGSVWETRMKMDEVKGGIKVFNNNNDDNDKNNGDEEGMKVYRRLRRNQSDGVSLEIKRKRRNWKPPEAVTNGGVGDKNPIQVLRARSDFSNSPRSCKDGEKEEEEEEEEDEIEIEDEVKSFDDKEIDVHVEKPMNVDVGEDNKEMKQIHEIPILPEIEKEEIGIIDLKMKNQPHPIEGEEEVLEKTSETQNRMQNIVDLVMWRDISKSAFVFGFGTFILLSSSYTKDYNFSLLSAISYLGLVYLALIFLYKSILRRGGVEFDEKEERCIIGEEEAIWALRFLLPYINEIFLRIRALFSGDPATTMRLAVVLFAMARCGSSLTMWTLAKMVFFGLFTVPKVFSSYSVQIQRYGKFWIERFRDGWESCTHKKAVTAAIFTLIWNMSSTVARIWAVFMLVVAVKFYQQYTMVWNEEEPEVEVEEEEEKTVIGVDPKQEQKQKEKQEDSKPGTGLSPGATRRLRVQQQQQQQQHRQIRGGPTTSSRLNNGGGVEKEIKVKKGT